VSLTATLTSLNARWINPMIFSSETSSQRCCAMLN